MKHWLLSLSPATVWHHFEFSLSYQKLLARPWWRRLVAVLHDGSDVFFSPPPSSHHHFSLLPSSAVSRNSNKLGHGASAQPFVLLCGRTLLTLLTLFWESEGRICSALCSRCELFCLECESCGIALPERSRAGGSALGPPLHPRCGNLNLLSYLSI